MKKLLSLLFMAFIPIVMMAYDVEVNGIYYDLDTSANTATVTFKGVSNNVIPPSYSGNVIIPSSIESNGVTYVVTKIRNSAFLKCTSLTSVEIPNSVTTIGENSFWGCTGLTSINIPDNVTSIGVYAFYNCSSLPVENDLRYADTYLVEAVDKTLSSYNIKSGTRFIGSSAFDECTNLTAITIPDDVTSIGFQAFFRCSSLTSVTIGNSVTSIEGNAFNECSSLTSINIPDNVTSIEGFAFMNCTGLTSVTIGNGVTNLSYDVFANCSSLTSVTIGNSVTSIGSSDFWECTSLTSIDIPDNVTSIGYMAFKNCTGLTSVTIGNGVTSIEGYAFADCEALEMVTCRAISVPTTNGNAFMDTHVENATLFVPDEAYTAYSATSPWSSFGTILPLSQATVITANSYTREYGDANPTFEYTCAVTLNGDPVITCAADATSAPGTYPITISQGTVTNTGLGLVDGTLTVTKAPLTITAKSYTIKEGDTLLTFELEYEGFKNSETETTSDLDMTALDITCTATDSNTPDTYDITVSGITSDNYDITFVAGTLTIQPAKVEITIASTGMATYCSAYDLDFSGITDFKACIATGYNSTTGNVIMQPVSDAPAGTGLYLQGTPGTYDVPCGESGSFFVNLLVGTTAATTISPIDGIYKNLILYNGSNGVGFYTIANDYTMGANKAYLQLPAKVLGTSAGANRIGVEFEDNLDGIENIDMIAADGATWYSLDGRQLNGKPTQKGIYVVNGRKVVIK